MIKVAWSQQTQQLVKVIEGDKNVTYVYKLKETPAEPKGNVYVHYVDTEGKTIKSDVTDEEAQPVDKDYDTVVDNRPQEIEFEGKTYELVPAGKLHSRWSRWIKVTWSQQTQQLVRLSKVIRM